MSATAKEAPEKMPGWEREFWQLLSPETTHLLKAELERKASKQRPVS